VERKRRDEIFIDTLNIIYSEKEKRGFIKLNALSLAFTLQELCSCCSQSERSWCCRLF